MQTTLIIKDLSASVELDEKALSAVVGGDGNQAVGTSQGNVQNMAAVANVGNASHFCGPATIQSDNTFTQDAHNFNAAANFDLSLLALRVPTLER
jgi:hypothetical protein